MYHGILQCTMVHLKYIMVLYNVPYGRFEMYHDRFEMYHCTFQKYHAILRCAIVYRNAPGYIWNVPWFTANVLWHILLWVPFLWKLNKYFKNSHSSECWKGSTLNRNSTLFCITSSVVQNISSNRFIDRFSCDIRLRITYNILRKCFLGTICIVIVLMTYKPNLQPHTDGDRHERVN